MNLMDMKCQVCGLVFEKMPAQYGAWGATHCGKEVLPKQSSFFNTESCTCDPDDYQCTCAASGVKA